MAERNHVSVAHQAPALLVKNLYSQGLLDRSAYDLLVRAAKYRHAAAHAYRLPTEDANLIQSLIELVRQLLGDLQK